MTAVRVFVGYKTKKVPDVERFVPEFSAPSTWKDEGKIKAVIEEKKAEFLHGCQDMPYTGTLEEVVLLDKGCKKVVPFVSKPGDKLPVSVRVRDYLLRRYPSAWADDGDPRTPPGVVFFGFEPRLFLKILGLECSLPAIKAPCPHRMWFDNADGHRDIIEAILPREFRTKLSLKAVLASRGPLSPEDAKDWAALIAGWGGPGVDAYKDIRIVFELALQLGLLPETTVVEN